MYRKVRGEGFIASGCACNATLDALRRENEINWAWCSYCAMITDGVMPDKLTFSLIAHADSSYRYNAVVKEVILKLRLRG